MNSCKKKGHLYKYIDETLFCLLSGLINQNQHITYLITIYLGFDCVFYFRRKPAISPREMNALLDYHNRVRSQVFPPAANMEYMLWDEELAKSADSWASRCVWDHSPTQAMKYVGQNLSVTSGRYQSITDLVRSWNDERHHFSYPNRCSGSVCSHYTQMVWASTSRVGCAVRKCSNMDVFGSTWREATLLVCNYLIKGNWVGEAPYKTGRPCSVCPPSYGGSCWRNQCTLNKKPRRL
uniref:SCP domain-containing protein n=1 Tax=Oreochromis aureus TaxID=47969 RepID=A0AAZ1X6V2_OREAU